MQDFPFKPASSLVWLKDEAGRIFHMRAASVSGKPIYNSPDNPIDISKSIEVISKDGNTLDLNIHGTKYTIDISAKGRSGECTRCGQCCVGCEHLVQHGKGVGHKNGTSCAVYKHRLRMGLKGCLLCPETKKVSKGLPACTMRFK